MKNIPKKLYLQIGDEVLPDENFNNLEHEYVTWCSTKCFDNDIEYVKAPINEVKEDKVLYVDCFFSTTKHNSMTVNCPNEDSEMSVIIRDNGRKCIYSMTIWEAEQMRDFLIAHIDNHKDSLKENEVKELLPNLDKYTENLSKIEDKDKWLNELRGKDEELIYKIKYATAGMCISDLSANRCAKEATEIALQYFTEKVKSLHNKYDRGEVGGIYNLAIFDVLEILK
ncbi:MAG: hypothetical protein ABI091_26500 [Ferruginibacter sp.]